MIRIKVEINDENQQSRIDIDEETTIGIIFPIW